MSNLSFSTKGNTLCALNGGKVAGVLCYTVQSKLGLIPITNTQRTIHLNQTTPPSGGPANTASQISFSQDGKHLIAAIKGIAPTPGYLAVWDFVEGKGLSENFLRITPGNGGLLPFSLTTIPGKNAFLSADPYLGFDIFDFSGGFKNSSGSSAVAVEGQKAICWSAYSKESGDFYLIDAALSQVIEVNVNNDLKGTMVHVRFPCSFRFHLDLTHNFLNRNIHYPSIPVSSIVRYYQSEARISWQVGIESVKYYIV